MYNYHDTVFKAAGLTWEHLVKINQYITAEKTAQAKVEAARALVQAQQARLGQTDIVAPDTVDELVVLPNLNNKLALRAAILGSNA